MFVKNSKTDYNFISGAVILRKNHWALFFVSILSQTIYYIDPIGETKEEIEAAAKNFRKYIDLKKYFPNSNFKEVQISHQKQIDSYNCGVFVCHFFEILLNQEIDLSKNEINIMIIFV